MLGLKSFYWHLLICGDPNHMVSLIKWSTACYGRTVGQWVLFVFFYPLGLVELFKEWTHCDWNIRCGFFNIQNSLLWMGSLGTSPVPVLLSLRRECVFTRESVLLTLGCLVFWLHLLITRWIVKGGCHCSLWHSSCALQIQVFLLLSKQTAALTLNQTEEILLPPWLFGSWSFVYKVSK